MKGMFTKVDEGLVYMQKVHRRMHLTFKEVNVMSRGCTKVDG